MQKYLISSSSTILLLFFFKLSFAQEVNSYPGTPSSSYNFNYSTPKKLYNSNDSVRIRKSETIKGIKIQVKGNIRLDEVVIIRDSKINDFEIKNSKALNSAVKNLYATGYFKDVKISKSGENILINIIENPIVNRIAFEGNSEIKDTTLSEEVSLKERNVFSTDRIKSDVLKIQNLYKRLGYFSVLVDPKIIRLEDNRINLVYEIVEGQEAKIKKINFIGNKNFSDSTLRDVIFSEETRWYKFWGGSDKFDQDRLNYDKDILKKYYFDNGYIDFRILSTSSQLVSSSKNFILNFKIFEGNRYKISDVSIRSNIKGFKNININKLVDIEKNDWFSSKDVEKTMDNIIEKASEYGFAFVDVRPKLKKEKNNVSIVFDVIEGNKFYVERINVIGNLKTHDKVIRREIELAEGDAFNLTKITRSERNLNSLALFETVDVSYDQIDDTNKAIVDVEIKERSTGEFSVGAGFSSLDGVLGNIGVKENNLFGEGKELSATLGLSTRRSSIDVSYTEPYFMGKDIATGIDLFNVRRNNKTYSGYKHNIIGFKLRTGYELMDDLRHFNSYTLKRDKIHDIDSSSSIYIKSQEGKSVTSMLGQALQYDKLNDRINPTDGYRLRLDLDFYGLGGDSKHIQAEIKVSNFYRIFDDFVLSTQLDIGYIYPINDVKINNRFFLTGDQMRGFQNSGTGPRDTKTSDALGGEQYAVFRNEFNLPIGLPEELGLRGLIFLDVGSLAKNNDMGEKIKDDMLLRASTGVGIQWLSPFGPVKVYLSRAIKKASYDKTETFRFSFGTTY